MWVHTLAFYVSAGYLNSGPYVYTASILPTESSLQPHTVFLMRPIP